MIPHHMHFFWGNDRMSWLRYMTLYSFCTLNPDWQVTLHRCPDTGITHKYWSSPNQQDFFLYDGADYSDRLADLDLDVVMWYPEQDLPQFGPSHLSNLFKWEQMATDGGWYADLDILWVRPMSHYLRRLNGGDIGEDMVITFAGGYFSIGLLASRGQVGFFRNVLSVSKHASIDGYQTAGIVSLYAAMSCPVGDWGMPQHPDCVALIEQQNPDVRVHNLPMAVVYPWNSQHVWDMFLHHHTTLPDETVGIHWYAGHPLSQQFNCTMNPATLEYMHNTIGHFARQVLAT